VVLGVGAACALVGFGAGILVSGADVGNLFSAPGRERAVTAPVSAAHPVPVAAGAVTSTTPALPDRFGVSLFNWGDRPLRAEVVSLPGWLSPLTGRTAAAIAPQSWGSLGFTAPVDDCRVSPGRVRVVVVEVRTQRTVTSYVVPLAEPADRILRAHHDRVCGARASGP